MLKFPARRSRRTFFAPSPLRALHSPDYPEEAVSEGPVAPVRELLRVPVACARLTPGVRCRQGNHLGKGAQNMVDRRQKQAVDEAAARFADTLAESYRIVQEQAAEARGRQERFAQDFSERVMEHLKEQTESGRAASERLTDQARRQREAGQSLARESVSAYMDFLNTAFSQYREGAQRAAGSAQEGARIGSQTVADVAGITADTTRASAEIAADATRETAETAAGRPPIDGYDEMNVGEVTSRLDGLSKAELRRTRTYEQGNKNRETLVAEIDRRLAATS